MDIKSIGANIRRIRKGLKMTQDQLAEKAGLSPNYIGMVERGEKIPSVESLINILNGLEASSDEVLCDLLHTGFKVKNTQLTNRMEKLSPEKRNMMLDLMEVLLKYDTP